MEKECGSWATAWLHTHIEQEQDTAQDKGTHTREGSVGQGRAGEGGKGKGYARAKVAEI